MRQPVAAEWHHLHLGAPEPEAAAAWYAELFGGRALQAGAYHLCLFEGSFLIWSATEGNPPKSVGSTLDHFGFSVDSLETTQERMVASGASVLETPRRVGPHRLKIAFLEDPWGAKVELLEDADLLGFHHVHLLVTDVARHRNWLTTTLGGRAETFNDLLLGVRFERMWVLYRQSEAELAATRGRAIDHLGFSVTDLDAASETLSRAGARPDGEARQVGELRVAFFEAPAGLRLELVTPLG